MVTKIFLVRHAEAEGNLFRMAHGQYNSNLTPRGYCQLHYLRQRFQDVHLDAVYGSDLIRAHATASALYVPRNLPFQPLPLLREVRLGDWEERTWAEIKRRTPEMYSWFNKRPDLWHVEGAETFPTVAARTVEGIRRIAAENPGKTVAATSHGAAMRILLGTLEGMSLQEIGGSGHSDNTAVSLLEVEGDTIRVIFRDDASHVPPEYSTFRRQKWYEADSDEDFWFVPLAAEDGMVLQAMLSDRASGQVAFRREADAMRITSYTIDPQLRGRHLGVQLLGQAVKYARRQGLETLVLACPDGLRNYFAKYGFESAGADMTMDLRPAIREVP